MAAAGWTEDRMKPARWIDCVCVLWMALVAAFYVILVILPKLEGKF